MVNRSWNNQSNLGAKKYLCGHANCGMQVASDKGYSTANFASEEGLGITALSTIYICPSCKKPTYFEEFSARNEIKPLPNKIQIPGITMGSHIKHLPKDISQLYDEIRNATSREANTLAILGCRKLLMHISVEQGAAEGLSFVQYLDHLVNKNYAPPNSKPWIDKIRNKGNEANHEIKIMLKSDVQEIITFIEMLLQFIYSFPAEALKN